MSITVREDDGEPETFPTREDMLIAHLRMMPRRWLGRLKTYWLPVIQRECAGIKVTPKTKPEVES